MEAILKELPLPLVLGTLALFIGLLLSLLLVAGRKRLLQEQLNAAKEELRAERERLEAKLEEVTQAWQHSAQQAVRLEEQKQALEGKLQQSAQEREKVEEKLRTQFENLANRIFEEKTSKFKKESEEGVGQLLMPLRERLQEFQKKVDESFGQQAKEQFSLKEEITRIVLANEKITVQAENLTNALKGESKTQGNWGEVVLERVLEDSGLRKGVDYRVQLEVKSTEGDRLRPDVVVMLPEDKHIIIDSKVSLTHYEQYCSEEDETRRAVALKLFLQSVRTHVTGLEQRRYQDTEMLGTPDFVLMFIPIEGAYALAVQQDAGLHSYAWDKRIVIVCPATLFATLRTIHSVWRIELQNRNAQEIARQGGNLYDKIAGFVQDMQGLGKRIHASQQSFDEAMNKLSEGKGNILSRTEQIKALGIKTTKQLPKELLGEDAAEEKHEALLEAAGA